MSVRQTAHRVCKHLPFPCEMEAYFKDEQMPIEFAAAAHYDKILILRL